jgi:hypothetical protein
MLLYFMLFSKMPSIILAEVVVHFLLSNGSI